MTLREPTTNCELCKFSKWCPNKRCEAMMALPLPTVPSRTLDELALERVDKAHAVKINIDQLELARHRPASLDDVIDNLRDCLAEIYGVPRCFFETFSQ